jgi:hypothetical protein
MLDVSMIIGLILEKTAETVIGEASRRETVVKLLSQVGLSADTPPPDFDGIYTFALIEYGVSKPRGLSDLFRQNAIKDAFRKSFEKRDRTVFARELSEYIQSDEGKLLFQLDYNPLREYDIFRDIFFTIADRARTVTEIRQDHTLNNIYDVVTDISTKMSHLISEKASPLIKQEDRTFRPKEGQLIIDVSTILDYPLSYVEGRLGQAYEINWRRIGSGEEIPGGGQTREYKLGDYSINVNYDKSGIAKGFHLFEGLEVFNYNLDQWPEILERFGLIVIPFPEITGDFVRVWKNYLGFSLKVATNRKDKVVTGVRIYIVPK